MKYWRLADGNIMALDVIVTAGREVRVAEYRTEGPTWLMFQGTHPAGHHVPEGAVPITSEKAVEAIAAGQEYS